MLKLTRHASERMVQRGIRHEGLNLVLDYGEIRFSHGLMKIVLTDKCLRGTTAEKDMDKFRGLEVVVSSDGDVITVMWNRSGRKRRGRRGRHYRQNRSA
jgi:hypothetical protein